MRSVGCGGDGTAAKGPLVSVITIFRDAEPFLREAIASVLAQTHGNWELALVDDGSTDGSTRIAIEYALRYPDRIRYLEHEGHANRGMSASRNLGIRATRGGYLAFLDADDVYLPGKLEHQVAILEARPEVAMVYGATMHWHSWTGRAEDQSGDYYRKLGVMADTCVQPPTLIPRFLKHLAQTPGTCGVLIRRSAIEAVGGFDERFRGMFEDQVLFYKLCARFPVFVESGTWDRYRQHHSSHSSLMLQSGEYGVSSRPNPSYRKFYEWLGEYLREEAIQDRAVLRAFHSVLRPYRMNRRDRLMLVAERVWYRSRNPLRRLKRLLRRLWTSTPDIPGNDHLSMSRGGAQERHLSQEGGPPISGSPESGSALDTNPDVDSPARLNSAPSNPTRSAAAGLLKPVRRWGSATRRGLHFVREQHVEPRLLGFRLRHIAGPREIDYGVDEVLAISVVRNGAFHLRSFLEHHFGLGVSHIVLLDNGSTDGTVEIARGYDRVTVLQTDAPYARYENTMKRLLARRYSQNRWNLIVDVDERFDYPESGSVELPALIRYLNSRGFTAMVAQMLDLFPDRTVGALEEPADQPFTRSHVYYDTSGIRVSDYVWGTASNPAIRMHWDGIRKTLFGTTLGLTKAPLAFVNTRTELFTDWHHVRNARVADTTAVLLHYPFAGSFRGRVQDAVEAKRYGAVYEWHYERYWQTLNRHAELSLRQSTSREWTGVNALLDEGFLVTSSAYRQWCAAQRGEQSSVVPGPERIHG